MRTACKWYAICPIKRFTDDGKLERYWVEHYCLVGNPACIRYQMEARYEPHPDNMLPNGEVRNDLDAPSTETKKGERRRPARSSIS